MREYVKIDTIWKRDTKGKITMGQYSLPVFEYLKDAEWVFTEKVDGTNTRVHWDGDSVRFGGRTDNSQIHNGLVAHLQHTFNEETMRAKFGGNPICLYGEGYGVKIQAAGGNYKADGQGFVLFDALCGNYWLERESLEDITATLSIPIVPIVMVGTLADAQDKVISGFDSFWGNFKAEGLVGVPKVALYDRRGNRVITKIKHKDFAHLAVAA